MDVGAGDQRRTLRNYITPGVQGISSSIARLTVEVNNFELRSVPYLWSNNPNSVAHHWRIQFAPSIFLEVRDTLKLNGVSTDAIRLHLFPFSLKDKARTWLHSLPSDSIGTWDELTRAFIAKFFPPSKTASLRNQITTFTEGEDESLYEAWEWFKDLLQLCPHHGLQKWMTIQIFCNVVTQPVRSVIDAAADGNLLNMTEDEAYNLIEKMALNNF